MLPSRVLRASRIACSVAFLPPVSVIELRLVGLREPKAFSTCCAKFAEVIAAASRFELMMY